MKSFLRRLFHWHHWTYTPATYYNEDLALVATPATRQCACGAHQWREEHCLGLNPPAYVRDWHDV